MKTLRKEALEKVYQDWLKTKPEACPFCTKDAPMWSIQPAKFPYDAVYSRHDLLIVGRHIGSISELTGREKGALKRLLDHIEDQNIYSSIMLNFKATQTVPNHLHFHLLTLSK